MDQLIFPPAYNNEAAHHEIKLLMMQHKQLGVVLGECLHMLNLLH
jgi:hypothetical protein